MLHHLSSTSQCIPLDLLPMFLCNEGRHFHLLVFRNLLALWRELPEQLKNLTTHSSSSSSNLIEIAALLSPSAI